MGWYHLLLTDQLETYTVNTLMRDFRAMGDCSTGRLCFLLGRAEDFEARE